MLSCYLDILISYNYFIWNRLNGFFCYLVISFILIFNKPMCYLVILLSCYLIILMFINSWNNQNVILLSCYLVISCLLIVEIIKMLSWYLVILLSHKFIIMGKIGFYKIWMMHYNKIRCHCTPAICGADLCHMTVNNHIHPNPNPNPYPYPSVPSPYPTRHSFTFAKIPLSTILNVHIFIFRCPRAVFDHFQHL